VTPVARRCVEKRRKKYKGAPKELLLEELEERGESLKNVEKYRKKAFVKIVGKEERVIVGEEAPAGIFRPRYLFGRLPEDRARSFEKTEYHFDEIGCEACWYLNSSIVFALESWSYTHIVVESCME